MNCKRTFLVLVLAVASCGISYSQNNHTIAKYVVHAQENLDRLREGGQVRDFDRVSFRYDTKIVFDSLGTQVYEVKDKFSLHYTPKWRVLFSGDVMRGFGFSTGVLKIKAFAEGLPPEVLASAVMDYTFRPENYECHDEIGGQTECRHFVEEKRLVIDDAGHAVFTH